MALSTLRPRLSTVDTRRLRPAPKQVDAHYSSPEHKAWRLSVLRAAGFRCQGVGCGAQGVKLYADHVIEIRDGGDPLSVDNGQALCARCHGRKTALKRGQRAHSSERPDVVINDPKGD
jgi:5-methylcytosine-specific restriction protein A